jgi:hypothetical protein
VNDTVQLSEQSQSGRMERVHFICTAFCLSDIFFTFGTVMLEWILAPRFFIFQNMVIYKNKNLLNKKNPYFHCNIFKRVVLVLSSEGE